MNASDIGLSRDAVPSAFTMSAVQDHLEEPLGEFSKTQRGAENVLVHQDEPTRMISEIASMWNIGISTMVSKGTVDGSVRIGPMQGVPPSADRAVAAYLSRTADVRRRIKAHLGSIPDERRRALTDEIASTFWDAGEQSDEAPTKREPVRRQEVFSAFKDVPFEFWWSAARDVVDSMQKLETALLTDRSGLTSLSTTRFPIDDEAFVVLGGTGPDVHDLTENDVLVVDLGGDDVYRGLPASGQEGRVAALLDLAGNDVYLSTQPFALGAGLWGVGLLRDVEGDDLYRARGQAIGVGVFGAGLLLDGKGDDAYMARDISEGAGIWGLGILSDSDGDDAYRLGRMGQGFAGVGGVGMLIDGKGNEEYFSGALWADPREQNVFHSMAQGFSLGIRDYTGGGIGALFDGGGHDSYRADYFGQGASYWYSLGVLYDREGRDTYSSRRYSQGAGVHASAGMLLDVLGDDTYHAWGAAQGMGWDNAVGFLVDQSGNDSYTADWGSQGTGGITGHGFFLDNNGSDLYYAGKDHGEGYGVWDEKRHGGSIGFFADTGGKDRYPDLGREGGLWNLERWGVGADVSTPTATLLDFSTNVPVSPIDKYKEQKAKEKEQLEKKLSRAEKLADPVLRIAEMLAVAGHWGLDDETPLTARKRILQLQPEEVLRGLIPSMDCRQTMGYLLQEEFYLRQGPSSVRALFESLKELPAVPAADRVEPSTAARAAVLTLYYLGQTASSGAVASIMPQLRSGAAPVRAAAAKALGEIFDTRHRLHAARLVEHLTGGEKSARENLAKDIAAISYGDRLRLIFELQPLSWRQFGPLMEPSMWSNDPKTVEEWARILWRRRNDFVSGLRKREDVRSAPEVANSLKGLLKDSSESVRHAGAIALGQMGEAAAAEDLSALLSDEFALVRNGASWALSQIGDPAAPVLASVARSTSTLQRRGALEALSYAAGPSTRAYFEDALRDADWTVRFRALDIIWRKRTAFYPASIGVQSDPLAELLETIRNDDPHPWVRAKARTCLAKWKSLENEK